MKKKMIAALLTAAMTVALFTGCGQDAPTASSDSKEESVVSSVEDTTSKADEEPAEKKEISILILDRGRVSADEGTMEQ